MTTPSDISLRQLLGESGFWQRVRATGLCPIPESMTVRDSVVDSILLSRYGSRIVRSLYTNASLDSLALEVAVAFNQKWSDLVSINTVMVDALAGKIKVTTEKGKDSYESKRKGDGTHSLAAYDSDELVNDAGSSSNETESNSTDHDLKVTEQTVDVNEALSNLQLKSSYNIIDVLATDIANYVTLRIY